MRAFFGMRFVLNRHGIRERKSKRRLDAYAKEKERARPMASPKMGNGTSKSRHDQSDWEAGCWLLDAKALRTR